MPFTMLCALVGFMPLVVLGPSMQDTLEGDSEPGGKGRSGCLFFLLPT